MAENPGTHIATLRHAIESRRRVTLRYHDQPDLRVVEPHALYESDRGEVMLDGYQVRGYSESGRSQPYWRPFRVRKIMAVAMLGEIFEPRSAEGYNPNRARYRRGLMAVAVTGSSGGDTFVGPPARAPRRATG